MSELRLQETQGSCSTRYPLQEVCWQDNIQTNGQRIIDDYPNIYVIRLIGKQKKQYLYKILQLGFYPQQVKRTQQSGYPIPNEYIVGVKVNSVDLIAKTQYNSFGEVVYTITWDSCNEKNQSVSSNKSASNASALFLQKLKGHNNSQFSEIILFGFDLECLERRRNQNQPVFKTQSRKKPFHELQSESQKNKRLKALASDICNGIESTIQSHNFYDTVLKSIELNINNLQVNFQNLESENSQSNQFLDSVVCACDKSLISRDTYRQLAAIMPEMVREYKVEKRRQEITRIMDHIIPIHMVQVNSVASNGAYRSLKDILFVLIPKLAYSKSAVLQVGDVIHVKLSGDGRQVGKHRNHVMLTACILNEHDMVLNSSNQHCIFLYDGTEQYESLQKAFSFLIDELVTLNTEGIIDSNNNHWKIEFWFGSD